MRYQLSSIIVAASMLAGVAAPAFSQSLADVARQEAERRKHITEPGKVYTEKDLIPAPPPSTPTPTATPPANGTAAADTDATAPAPPSNPADGTAAPASASGAPPATPPADTTPKDEKAWSKKMKDLQDKLGQDRVLVDAMQSRINGLTADFTARDDPAQRAVIEQDRDKALSELDRLRKAVADDEKAISDLQEQARRAGVPPGWLRS
jgi:hypothetical protein